MAISVQSGFQVGNIEPIDARISVADQSARLGFASDNVYEGLVVYQKDTDKLYVLVDASNPSNNSSWSEVVISGGGGTNLSGIFSGSFSGSFEGDGSGLTGVAPIAGNGIDVTGTTVSIAAGGVTNAMLAGGITNAKINNSYINVGDRTVNLGATVLNSTTHSATGSFKGPLDGTATKVSITSRNTNTNAHHILVARTTGSDGNFLYGDQDFKWIPTSNTLLVGEVKATGILSGSSLETSGQVTIGTVNSADTAERTALVVDGTGNVQSLELGDAVTTHSGSLTVAQADGFYLTDNSSTDSEYNVIFSTDAPGNYIGAQGDGDSFTYNPGSNTLTVETLVGNVTGTASSASYVSAAKVDGTVASATNAESASHVAAAFDTVSVTNATITLTDMAGNTSSGTVNNVSNATTAVNATNATNATNINVDQSSEDDNFHITFTGATTGNAALLVDNNGKLTYNPNTDVLTVGSTLSVGGTATVGSNLTVTGDLIVNGTTTTLNTTNLEVEDAFILLRSGSSTVGSSGIIFGGSEGELNSGSALVWAAGYNSNDGRLAITTGSASTITGDPDITYYLAGVYEGTATGAAEAQADHPGNIRIESNEIYIYV